jgi:hypothetical protein
MTETKIATRLSLLDVPVPLQIVTGLKQNFLSRYAPGIKNPINVGFRIPYSVIAPLVPQSYLGQEDKGVAFQYGVDSQNYPNAFTLIVSLWEKNTSNQAELKPLTGGKYVICEPLSYSVTTNSSEVQGQANNYHTVVQIKLDSGYWVPISDVNNHPLFCYYTGKEVEKFIDDHDMDNSAYTFELGFDLCSEYVAGVSGISDVQNVIVSCIKNGVHQTNNSASTTYANRSLNLGKVCPPQCTVT